MSAVKATRALQSFGARTAVRIGENIPQVLWDRLTSGELAVVARLVEAAYLDGYQAAGGDTSDTVEHCDTHRQHLMQRLSRGN